MEQDAYYTAWPNFDSPLIDTRLEPDARPTHQAPDSDLVRHIQAQFTAKCNIPYTKRAFTAKFGICVEAVADLSAAYAQILPNTVSPLLHALAYYHAYPRDRQSLAAGLGTNVVTIRQDSALILDLSWRHFDEIHWESMLQYPVPTRGALAGVAFTVDATLGLFPTAQFGHKNYERLRSEKHKLHGKKAISATPLLGGCFNYWPRHLANGVEADVTLYRTFIKPLVKDKKLRFADRTLPLLGLGDKGFDGEETLLSPHKGRSISELHQIFNHYVNQPRQKVENSYHRRKSNFQARKQPYRTPNDEERYDEAAWFSAQCTEIDCYYRPLRRTILSEIERFL